jgi:hypothetical protein
MDFDEGRDRKRTRTILAAAACAVALGLLAICLAIGLGWAQVASLGPAVTEDAASVDEPVTGDGDAASDEDAGKRLMVGDVTFTDSQRLSDLSSDEVEGLSAAASAWVAAVGADASDGIEITSLTDDTVGLHAELSAGGHTTTVTYDGTTWRYQGDDGTASEVPAAQESAAGDDVAAVRSAVGEQAAATLASDFGAWADSQGIPHAAATLDPSKVTPTADGLGLLVTIAADDGTSVTGTFNLEASTWTFDRG